MKLELEFLGALCSTMIFAINDITASISDFGEKYDHSPETADDYGCGDRKFTRFEPKPIVLAKYGITVPQYELIAGQLEIGLSFGKCNLCV